MCEMNTRKKFHRITISSGSASTDPTFNSLKEILKRPVLGHYVRQIVCTETPPSDGDYPEGAAARNEKGEAADLARCGPQDWVPWREGRSGCKDARAGDGEGRMDSLHLSMDGYFQLRFGQWLTGE